MRKNNLLLLLLMALIVMSCSKDETSMSIPQEGNAIEFGTYVGRDAQTRASVIDADTLKDKGFGVFAYYTGTTDYANASAKPNFMYNQHVKYASSKWGYEPLKYWPNNTGDKVSFFAYAPYSTTTGNFVFTPAKDDAGDPTITYTVNATAKLQEDLLWGVDATGVATSNPNFGLPYINQQKQTTTGNIKFQFKHALARIGFNVQAMVDNLTTSEAIADETDIVVTKVELIGNFYASGALNLNNTTPNVPLWVATVPETERTFELNAGTSGNTNFKATDTKGVSPNRTFGQPVAKTQAQLNADDSYLMVIPQNFEGTNPKIKIRVTYDVITKDTSLDTGQSKITNEITSSDFTFNFAAGKAYTFNLHLGMTSVKFDATVSDWGTETGTVVNVPINTAP